MKHRQAFADAGLNGLLGKLHATAAHAPVANELGQQLTVAAGEVEHRGAGGHQLFDELVVDASHGAYVA